jgi:hypothetical protein
MHKITNQEDLLEAIILLEIKQAAEKQLLREQFKDTCEQLKPVNLIKNAFTEFTTGPDLKANLLDTTISMAAGYFSKKAVVGSTHNPFKQLAGTLLQMAVTGIVSKNTDSIKSGIMNFITTIINKKHSTTKDEIGS